MWREMRQIGRGGRASLDPKSLKKVLLIVSRRVLRCREASCAVSVHLRRPPRGFWEALPVFHHFWVVFLSKHTESTRRNGVQTAASLSAHRECGSSIPSMAFISTAFSITPSFVSKLPMSAFCLKTCLCVPLNAAIVSSKTQAAHNCLASRDQSSLLVKAVVVVHTEQHKNTMSVWSDPSASPNRLVPNGSVLCHVFPGKL